VRAGNRKKKLFGQIINPSTNPSTTQPDTMEMPTTLPEILFYRRSIMETQCIPEHQLLPLSLQRTDPHFEVASDGSPQTPNPERFPCPDPNVGPKSLNQHLRTPVDNSHMPGKVSRGLDHTPEM